METAVKRSNIRYLIDLEVQVEVPNKPPLLCQVRDYCLSGMFITLPHNGNAVPSRVPLAKNEAITIQFTNAGGKSQRIPAQVAHVVPNGFGVRFGQISDEALNALLEIAAAQESQAEQGAALAGVWQSEGRAGLLLLLKDALQRHLIGLFNTFHETVVDQIFEKASRPRNTNEQNQMFEALDYLNRQRNASFQKVFNSVVAGFDAFAAGKPPTARLAIAPATQPELSELSLVDDREFEEWLWASSTVARLETEYDDALFALNQRLSSLQGRAIDNESNPLGAAALSHAFQELIREQVIAEPVKELVISLFQAAIEERFGALITEANNHLVERGILPEIKRDMSIVRLGNESGRQSVTPTTTEKRESPAPSSPPLRESEHRSPAAHNTTPAGAPAAGLAQVRNLMRGAQQSHQISAGGSKVSGEVYGVNELHNALSNIEDRLSTIRANRGKGDSILAQLKESLVRMGGDPNKAIPVAQQESIEVIDHLMGSVQDDPIVVEQARPWLAEMEMPLLKAAIRDENLIENRDHPATHFLNRLDTIGKSLADKDNDHNRAVRQEISSLINQVKENSEQGDGGFVQALSRLDDLHDNMRRKYEASVAEVARRCDEEYGLETKRDALLTLLDDYLGGQMVPVMIFEIMDAGWKNLLLRSYIREGADGKIFRRFLEVIDQIMARLTGDSSRVNGKLWPEQTLLELVSRGLRQVPVGDEVIERLMDKLVPQFAMATVDPKSIEMKLMPRITGVTSEKRRRALEARIAALKIGKERWGKAEESIRSMHSGDMLTLVNESGISLAHKLAWVAPNSSRYVFVDGEGHSSTDMRLEELTIALLTGKASILEGWDVPLMDRATYSMLLAIHNKLLSETSSDALTGVLNRRAFGLEVEKVLERTRIEKNKNMLCALDLDHFALINTMCSHDEGDRLLKEVAQLLKEHSPKNSVIGRLGGDEFALMMPDMSRTEGLNAVRRLQSAMHAHPFKCKNQNYRLAASFGIAEINELADSGSRLLTAVENACRTAKDSGRDRIETYHESNDELTQREKLINIAGQLRNAMDNDRMQLVCQRILPVTHREIDQAPYYEVLLRVLDENGQPISHEQFIQAAEMYNRTIDVDRWVVKTVIEWMEQRQSAGKQLPIFSINLSGRSVNSKEFMDTIVTRMIKSSLPRNHLCFEITETAAIGDMGQATHFINRIKRLGCSFSLDDFGTGVSSYSYLKALPVDYIKIDGNFVRNAHKDPHDLAVIKSINEIGHAMGKKTIAEFVENEDILARLHEIGVDYAQGYGIEKPIPITQLN